MISDKLLLHTAYLNLLEVSRRKNCMQKQTSICCNTLNKALSNKIAPLYYSDRLREYFLHNFFDPTGGVLAVCPWCGKKLPTSLREEYHDATQALNLPYEIDAFFDPEKLPKEFQTNEWWKKRGL